MSVKNKIILITGASSGIGKSCAEHLAKIGFTVYGTSRNPDAWPQPDNYKLIPMDVSDDATVKKGVDMIIKESSRIDVVVNNAGYGIAGAIVDTPVSSAIEQLDTLFWGAVRVIKAVFPYMEKQNSGLIINISSIGGLMGLPYQGFYSAAKFAIEGYSEALYKELHSTNIKVVMVEPGDFNTGFTANRKIVEKPVDTEKFRRTLKVIENDEKSGQDPIRIAQLIEKIIAKKNPRLRYVVGAFDQKLAAFLKRLLPQKIFDWIIMDHYKVK